VTSFTVPIRADRSKEGERAGKKKVIDARARIRRWTEEGEEGEGSPSGFQRRVSPGRADRKYRVAHQIFRRERPRVMAASRPDEAHRVIGRGEGERYGGNEQKRRGGGERQRERERNLLYRSTVVRAMAGRRERDTRDEEGRWQLRYSITSGISSASKLYAKCTRGPSPPHPGAASTPSPPSQSPSFSSFSTFSSPLPTLDTPEAAPASRTSL